MTRELRADVHTRVGDFDLVARLDVDPGELLVVIGPNGAGKSTLLRTLAGLLPYDGSVSSGRVGMVFSDHRLFPHLDARANVAFGPRSRGVSRATAHRSAEAWLTRLGIGDLVGRRPDQLSGGQSQRVALARALASEPDLLLLDEPTAALDAETRVEVRRELRRHLEGFDGPVVLVTHDPLEALVLADRIVVMEQGRITQVGRPSEIARRPATPYVARFVGVNLYAGQRVADGVELDGGWRLAAADDATSVGERVLAAVHPSAITLHLTRPEGSSRNVWRGVVVDVELIGDRVRVEVAADDGPRALVDLTVAALTELALEAGSPVWLAAKATEIDLYRA